MRYLFANHAVDWYPHRRCADPPPERRRRHLFGWIRDAGFDGVELGDFWMDFYRMTEPAIVAIRREAEDAGTRIVVLNALRKSVTTPDGVGAANRADLWRALDVAALVGAELINVSLAVPLSQLGVTLDQSRGRPVSPGGSQLTSPDEVAEAAAFLRELGRAAGERGLALTIELHFNGLADDGPSTRRLVELIDQPNVGANPDLGNYYWTYDVPPRPWQEEFLTILSSGRMNLWHVKNVQRVHVPENQSAHFVHASLDAGDIDYRWCLLAAREHGWDGTISIEGAGPGDVLAFARRGLDYLRQVERELASY